MALERSKDPEATSLLRRDRMHRVLAEALLAGDASRASVCDATPTTSSSITATDIRLPAGFRSNHQSNWSPCMAPSPQASWTRRR